MPSERDCAAFQAAIEAAAFTHLGVRLTQYAIPMIGLDQGGDMVQDITVPNDQLAVNTLGMLH
ncbi:hypothetical protein D9V32_13540 [Mycetocola tolaasinivorans]|uniref:Uncharacterized protein n=1 Tax=Mycetocola tolaasinivorans TaxID=76635 RepID=A0A3L7A235_9MICO|nr:hypothetical protein D9V32_13540 [Mycetocola tolaasinivorans]